MRAHRSPAALACLLAAAPLARATDWIVDGSGGPGSQFTTIQAAVDAAQTGDHVLVRGGTYAGFVVDGKGIVVAEAPGNTVAISGSVRVMQIPAGAGVQMIDLTVDLSGTPGLPPLEVASCTGPVVVARCILRGFDGPAPTDAARVASSTRVFFHDCELAGGDAPWSFNLDRGARGLRVTSSAVEVHRSTVTGGRGGSSWDGTDQDDIWFGQDGGSGMSLTGSSALVERSTITGGAGADSSSDVFDPGPNCPGNGGDAVEVLSGGAVEHFLSTLTGGPGGLDVGWWWCQGSTGLPIDPPSAASGADRIPLCPALYTRCPCGNEGLGANGCANSITSAGARLDVAGAASLAGDTLTLTVSGIGAAAPALFFQGTAVVGTGTGSAFGDGIRCAGGFVTRLGSRTAAGGTASLGFGTGSPPISTLGQVPGPGAARLYQVWYRNSAAFCSASTFNLTNGYEILWAS